MEERSIPTRSCLALSAIALLVLVPLAMTSALVRADGDQAANTPRGRVEEPEPEPPGIEVRVASGDTLSHIAERFGVTVDDLVRWNPGLRPDRIRAGQTLTVMNGQRRVVHVVQRGDLLSHIATRYEVRVDDLLRWNARLSRDRVSVGREIVLFTRVPESRSRSVGHPNAGRLEDARQLRRHPGLLVRAPDRAWGTDETVRWIAEAFDVVRAADPHAPRVEVHDISHRRGGPMQGHHSHESGRDADISYYQTACRGVCSFRRIGPDQLDVARQWALLSHWLQSGRVEAIFMDHALQRVLYEHARASGVSRNDLSRWFQYPRSAEDRYGVIRHEPQHADHLHVRFVCHETDPDCR
jgi:LysM repeat protein